MTCRQDQDVTIDSHLHKSLSLGEEVAEEESVMETVSQVPVVGFDGSNEVAGNESGALKTHGYILSVMSLLR